MILDDRYRQWAATPTDEARELLFTEVRKQVMRSTHDDDVCQNVCLTLLDKLATFKPVDEYAFTRYVTAITTKHRLKQASQHQCDQWEPDSEIPAADEQFISLSELSPFTKQVARSILAGNSLKETADSMGLKPATLRKKLQRARHETPVSLDVLVEG